MENSNQSKIKNAWLFYILSIFPLAGLIIGALFYKKNKTFARNCIGIALALALIYVALHSAK
ncbi:MAG: hypothetical protein A2351_08250 [Omnitrophica bacterium RIFOXYB12_FULL_50_7]|nr:MAG: hypothetical protein A2351_08250 [Omnitrophica bacterium RIFOXYB12_FULL_50_7]